MAQYEMRTMDNGRSYVHVPVVDNEWQGDSSVNRARRPSVVSVNGDDDGCKNGVILVRAIVVFIFLIITLVFNSSRSKSSYSTSHNTYPPPSRNLNLPNSRTEVDEQPIENFPRVVNADRERMKGTICDTPTCVDLADEILSSMNNRSDPCQDFYQYACGGWIRKHTPVPPGSPVWNPMYQLNLENRLILKKIMEQKAASNSSKIVSSNFVYKKARDFYWSCMDPKGLREKMGVQPLRDLFKKIDGWSTFAVVTRRKSNSTKKSFSANKDDDDDDYDGGDDSEVEVDMDMRNWSFEKTLGRLTNDYGVGGGLIKWSVDVDPRMHTKNIIMIRHDPLTPKDNIAKTRSMDEDDDDDDDDDDGDTSGVKRVHSTLSYMKRVTQLMGITSPSVASSIVTDIFLFQLELNIMARTFKKPGGSLFRPMGMYELKGKFGLISWMDLVNNGLSKVNKKVTIFDQVLVQEPDLFVKLDTFVRKKLRTPAGKATLRNFMMFKLVWQMIPYLSNIFYESLDLFDVDFGDPEVWETCLLQTDKYFGLALGAMYRSENELAQNTRAMSQEMMTNIRKAFQDNLFSVSWLDSATRSKVHLKAEGIRSAIGYPDFLPKNNPTRFLDQLYSGLSVKDDDLFGNVVNAFQFKLRKNWAHFKQPASKNQEWEMNPGKAAAYYYGVKNQVIITAGILQKPFFDSGFPDSFNYGSIGMIIGHEVTHAFGDSDSIFGNQDLASLPLPLSSRIGFDNRTKCLKDQYSFFKVKNKTLDLEKTLTENMADNGGLKMAYKAYRKNEKLYGDFFLPRLNLTHDQLFFVAAAQLWCAAGTEEAKVYQMENDVHAPGELRGQIPLKNIPQFAQAFNCPWPTPMNPTKRCKVW